MAARVAPELREFRVLLARYGAECLALGMESNDAKQGRKVVRARERVLKAAERLARASGRRSRAAFPERATK